MRCPAPGFLKNAFSKAVWYGRMMVEDFRELKNDPIQRRYQKQFFFRYVKSQIPRMAAGYATSLILTTVLGLPWFVGGTANIAVYFMYPRLYKEAQNLKYNFNNAAATQKFVADVKKVGSTFKNLRFKRG